MALSIYYKVMEFADFMIKNIMIRHELELGFNRMSKFMIFKVPGIMGRKKSRFVLGFECAISRP